MKELLEFLVKNITGTTNFEVTESEENGIINLFLTIEPTYIGIVIGKEGKTIKSLRKILSILGVLEKKSINISVKEKL